MPFIATIANTLWAASNLPAYRRFRRALREPRAAQRANLRRLLEQNRDTAFGKAHRFDKIDRYEEFIRRVPLADYAALEPWISRVRHGEANVLTKAPITHLVPTSGSTGSRKLIPFGIELQREFNAAVGPWLVDLARQVPGLLGGPAYWSITPPVEKQRPEESVVPIGFETDAAYLGAGRRRLAAAVMAVPSTVGRAKSLEAFRYETLLHLLRCRELRLISVWHPSFLTLLLDALPSLWDKLLTDLANGTDLISRYPRRAEELRDSNPCKPGTLWPSLRIISCWGDGAATPALNNLRERFPHALLQPKGLIATEAFVTLPFESRYPLAVESHFFEFIDSEGRILPAEALNEEQEYQVVVTTAGGLWRYQLADRVKVTGFMEKTPTLKFLGRGENVSDRFGEKLSEAFVAEALREVLGPEFPAFTLLAPDEDDLGWRYTLYVEGAARSHWADNLDRVLRKNPHYANCRELGQLLALRVFLVTEKGFGIFASRQALNGIRLGDIKPAFLSRIGGWSRIFPGVYIAAEQESEASANSSTFSLARQPGI
jgi:hypothetical protein